MVRLPLLALFALFAMPAMTCENDPTCPMHLQKDAHGKVAPAAASHADHSAHGGHNSPAGANMNEATQALDAAMAKMHAAMAVPYTGNADIDFLRGMIPHHAGAVDMAKIVLKHGRDPQVRRLAREIIRAQEYEINLMTRWAAQLEAKQQGPGTDSRWLGDE